MAIVNPVAISVSELESLVSRMLHAAGVDSADAVIIGSVMADAEASGNNAQGLVRLPVYMEWARTGRLTTPTRVRLVRDGVSTLALDADLGWGQPAAVQAMDLCIERARASGLCMATVANGAHLGSLGFYARRAASAGLIGWITASSNPGAAVMAPWGGTQPLFGTNPIAIAFPRPDGPPVVVDLATSQIAAGDVMLAKRLGIDLPFGCAQDTAGRPTTDPGMALPPNGSLLPLGGHKGYALAVAVEVLSGVLAGGYPPRNAAYLIGALNPAAFLPTQEYQQGITTLSKAVHTCPVPEGNPPVRLPGEGSAARAEAARQAGVLIPLELWREVVALAATLEIAAPEVRSGS